MVLISFTRKSFDERKNGELTHTKIEKKLKAIDALMLFAIQGSALTTALFSH